MEQPLLSLCLWRPAILCLGHGGVEGKVRIDWKPSVPLNYVSILEAICPLYLGRELLRAHQPWVPTDFFNGRSQYHVWLQEAFQEILTFL